MARKGRPTCCCEFELAAIVQPVDARLDRDKALDAEPVIKRPRRRGAGFGRRVVAIADIGKPWRRSEQMHVTVGGVLRQHEGRPGRTRIGCEARFCHCVVSRDGFSGRELSGRSLDAATRTSRMSHTSGARARACVPTAPGEDASAVTFHPPAIRPTRIFVVTRTKFVTEVIQSSVGSIIFLPDGFGFRGFNSRIWFRELGIGSLKA